MYCTSCGTRNEESASHCANCGSPLATLASAPPRGEAPPPVPGKPAVPNYLTHAVVLTICCCWPFSLPAIYAAADVNFHLGAGDLARAQEASRRAKKWCWVSFGVGIGVWILYAIVIVAAGLLENL